MQNISNSNSYLQISDFDHKQLSEAIRSAVQHKGRVYITPGALVVGTSNNTPSSKTMKKVPAVVAVPFHILAQQIEKHKTKIGEKEADELLIKINWMAITYDDKKKTGKISFKKFFEKDALKSIDSKKVLSDYEKYVKSITFEDKLKLQHNKLKLSNDEVGQITKAANVVHSERKSWKKAGQDRMVTSDNVNIFYHAAKDSVFVQLKELGKGTFKSAYSAIDFDSGQLSVVTHQTLKTDSTSEHYHEQFSAKGLKEHPNLLIPFHAGVYSTEAGEMRYEFTKLCAGGDLNGYENKLSDNQKLSIARDVLSGLKELHEKGFQHSDISGGNILLTANGKGANLMDFDEIKILQGNEKAQERQMKSDVKQMGAVLYHVFNGYDEAFGQISQEQGMDVNSQKEANISMSQNYNKLQISEKDPLQVLIKNMCNPEIEKRPTASEALAELEEIIKEKSNGKR